MSIDAVAILRITALDPPMTPFGVPHPVRHAGDASLVNLMAPFDPALADGLAHGLRRLLGPALDLHDDPRGVLLVADLVALDGEDYAALVAAHGEAGAWAAVPAEDAPAPLPPGPAGALLAEMVAALGEDRAFELEMRLNLGVINLAARPGEASEEAHRAALAEVAAVMGVEFAGRYDAALREDLAAGIAGSINPPPIRLE